MIKHSEIAEFFELDAVALAERIRQNDVQPEALLQRPHGGHKSTILRSMPCPILMRQQVKSCWLKRIERRRYMAFRP